MELLFEKSKSLNAFKTFKVTIERKFGKKIKCVNFDKGGEYCKMYDEPRRNPGSFTKYLQDCGIKANYITPRTLE